MTPYLYRYFLLFNLWLWINLSPAQKNVFHTKLPLTLISDIEKKENKNAPITALVHTHEPGIFYKFPEVVYKPIIGHFYKVTLPAHQWNILGQMNEINFIQYDVSKPFVLNDTMLVNNRIDSVHAGYPPLNIPFTGKNVVVGFIDTGIDIKHPDFKDSIGNTRILGIWDQTQSYDGWNPFGYGTFWNSSQIDQGICTSQDQWQYYSHGTNVSGIACSNGKATGNYKGVAPDSWLAIVSSNFNLPNWTLSVAEATAYLFALGDSLQMPVVINASVGTYIGSHDGSDPSALLIDSLVKAKPGRMFVCAAGNAGHIKFHLGYQWNYGDTNFTWFQYNPSLVTGQGGMFFELWADTADVVQALFEAGFDKPTPFERKGSTGYFTIASRVNQLVIDTIKNNNGEKIGVIKTWAALQGDKYLLQVLAENPDSANYHLFLQTAGKGKFDIWSDNWLGYSKMLVNIPNPQVYPIFNKYKMPDTLKTIVSSFTCLPSVLTVGNYVNRQTYTDVNGNTQVMPYTPGSASLTSSLGPTRKGLLKPDVCATGDITISSGDSTTIAALIANGQSFKVAQGGFHMRNGGTSMASPVVAGLAALYLEKCPNASWHEIKSTIIQNTFSDNFTGTLPNFKWGNGKINGFKTMINARQNGNISIIGAYPVCEGDSVLISTDNTYLNTLWNNSIQKDSFYMKNPGTYFYTAENLQKCKIFSDTIQAIFYPLPPSPQLYFANDTLFCIPPGNYSYQWFINGLPLNHNYPWLYMQPWANATYHVMISDSNGCSALSQGFVINGINNEDVDYLKVYPNPFSDELMIINNGNNKEAEIFDLRGKIMFKTISLGERLIIPAHDWASGVYILKTNTNQFIKIFKQ